MARKVLVGVFVALFMFSLVMGFIENYSPQAQMTGFVTNEVNDSGGAVVNYDVFKEGGKDNTPLFISLGILSFIGICYFTFKNEGESN